MLADDIREVITEGRVFDLGQTLEKSTPSYTASGVPFVFSLFQRHGDRVTSNGMSAANDSILICEHFSTHIDSLGHMSRHGRLHGGVDAAGAQSPAGLKELGAEKLPAFVGRGVLLDVAAFMGVDVLPGGHGITGAELAETRRAQGTEIRQGDAVLVRTGWMKHWSDAPRFTGEVEGCPGLSEDGARWLAAKGMALTGTDTLTYEVFPAPDFLIVHGVMLVEAGVPIVENLFLEELSKEKVYSFLLAVLPLKIVGATGSPVRPVAIR